MVNTLILYGIAGVFVFWIVRIVLQNNRDQRRGSDNSGTYDSIPGASFWSSDSGSSWSSSSDSSCSSSGGGDSGGSCGGGDGGGGGGGGD